METRSVMTRAVKTVRPETPLDEALQLFVHARIHGAPVVDPEGRLLGMVSFTDLAERAGEDVTVEDVMRRDVPAVFEETPLGEAAALMLRERVRRLPVLRGDRVVGILTATDIAQTFINLHEEPRRRRSPPHAPRRRAGHDAGGHHGRPEPRQAPEPDPPGRSGRPVPQAG